ncbi:methyltransferase domain-containing protein [Sanguibacter sp. HDW7]|uniref:methyltransferase domain-containing protein n=1 Tax=Sanguibacter sp. HDW7 TaxID=2714931 RepID=UPI00140D1607|nr:methyltransferase domain-containing protein [Sanguibacter sp. HDW7]QIK84783.1 methyltransferase domain-containing protein [Sanguibacter sp. HDW7]
MQCAYFDAGVCRSCTHLGEPYPDQLAAKVTHAQTLLGDVPSAAGAVWLDPVASPSAGFRNKAKMVVGGTVDAPTLGILDELGRGVDLQGCGLHSEPLAAALPVLAAFVTRARLEPYDVPARRGELKHVLVTLSADGELMVRFVVRSTEPEARVRKHLPWLLDVLPGLRVVSLNVQPEHKAVLEGAREIVLTEASSLLMRVGGLDLHLRPQSFFQTNTQVAAALYAQGAAWVRDVRPRSVWDLYCGVGGFALAAARALGALPDGSVPGASSGAASRPGGTLPDGSVPDVLGVEVSEEAVASATLTASTQGIPARFVAGDATAFALATAPSDVPDLVIVNPPRRGLGPALATWLETSGVPNVLYSSCNARTLAADLQAMPSLTIRTAQVLDMFPQTPHYEVATLLSRTA